MVRKLITVDLKDENITSSASTKKVNRANSTQTQVEELGVIEINNKSSRKKLKNDKELGFEKNTMNSSKKSVKSKLQKVEDYFDFDLRQGCTKLAEEVSKEPVKCDNADVRISENAASSVKYTLSETNLDVAMNAEACNCFEIDDEAKRIISVARMGSLFDC